jgi:hypothetical protein
MLGVWVGTIATDAVGEGAVVLILDGELITPTIPLVSGRWSLTFPDGRFSGQGPARAITLPENGHFVVTLDRVPSPCPSEPGGVVESVLSASLVRTGERLRGRYITGLCSGGGTIDLERR